MLSTAKARVAHLVQSQGQGRRCHQEDLPGQPRGEQGGTPQPLALGTQNQVLQCQHNKQISLQLSDHKSQQFSMLLPDNKALALGAEACTTKGTNIMMLLPNNEQILKWLLQHCCAAFCWP